MPMILLMTQRALLCVCQYFRVYGSAPAEANECLRCHIPSSRPSWQYTYQCHITQDNALACVIECMADCLPMPIQARYTAYQRHRVHGPAITSTTVCIIMHLPYPQLKQQSIYHYHNLQCRAPASAVAHGECTRVHTTV